MVAFSHRSAHTFAQLGAVSFLVSLTSGFVIKSTDSGVPRVHAGIRGHEVDALDGIPKPKNESLLLCASASRHSFGPLSRNCLDGAMQITLSKNIPAIPLEHVEDGQERLGAILRLPRGAELDICGSGFDGKTVKVFCSGRSYFVFIQDLREQAAAAGA